MGSGSFRREEDKTAFESLQAAADQPLINFPVDDVTSRAPATTKGMCVCVAQKILYLRVCVRVRAPGLCMHSRLLFTGCGATTGRKSN